MKSKNKYLSRFHITHIMQIYNTIFITLTYQCQPNLRHDTLSESANI